MTAEKQSNKSETSENEEEKQETITNEETEENVTFKDLGVVDVLCEACEELKWKKPSKIQKESIPVALQGKDIIGLAETGSGKTGAFALPILQALLENPQRYFALVMTPTRELAFQISEQFEALGASIGVKCAVIVGGMDMVAQALMLSKKPHIIVATPGRLVDHLENTKGFNLKALKYLVMDEADRILNMDFEVEVDKILRVIPRERRTYLFSATMTKKVQKLQRASLQDPVKVEVSTKYQTVEKLLQYYIFIPVKYKDVYLVHILNEMAGNSFIVFVSTCANALRSALLLRNLGLAAVPLHGQMSQNKRLAALNKFKNKSRSVLICTDVASRGLDIPHVDVVINLDIPLHSKDYIHRVGRTARAGRAGKSITFVSQPTKIQTFEGVSVVLHQTNITRLTARAIHSTGHHLHRIQHLSIMGAPKLEHIAVEDLTKMPNLKSFFITQAPLLHRVAPLPALPELRTFMITTSGLLEVPNLSHVHDSKRANTSLSYLQAIDLEGNHIKRISSHALRVRADQVSLNYNLIEDVPAYAFKNAQISKLSFKGNTKLKRLDENAFAGTLLLRQLDLSNTAVTSLPTKGLEKLEILRIEKTPSLKYIPSIYEFQHLEKAFLTHHFHCCAFAFPERHDPARHKLFETQIAIMQQKCLNNEKSRRRRSLDPIREIKYTDQTVMPLEDDASTATTSEEYGFFDEYFSDSGSYEDDDQGQFHDPVNNTLGHVAISADCGNFSLSKRIVECTPLPDALNPCEDVMGWSWLRASVWFVVTAAVVGNVAVLLVLLTNHTELTVPRFLMCHLAFSDLCTGLYLFMLAVVDLRSYGEFFNYAYNWQYGVGCKIAGFLSVFSGQLSVITLTIVTLERWFAITYAIYLERRISLASAAKIMVGGWLFSILMAGLPLVGVSDYSSTSICLPVENKDVGDGIYQGLLFLTNAVAWVTIVVCYVQIYRSLGGGGENYGGRRAAAAAERRIANKMALLIGTDLLCWAPVAFFGVTALAGVPLVDVSHGKVLLVFFYPLNACANPFLYAILTKQYRRDFLTLIARTGKCNWLIEKYKLAATPPPTGNTNPSTPAQLLPLVDYQRSQSQVSKENSEGRI